MSESLARPDLSWFVEHNANLVQALYATYAGRIAEILEAEGLEGGDLHAAQLALHHTAPLDADALVFAPYGARDARESNLRRAAERGVLAAVDGGYRPTERARALLTSIVETIDATLSAAPVPAAHAGRAAQILSPQVLRCEACGFPTPHLDFGRHFDPGPEAPPLVRLRRAVFDLNLFRDDAHEDVIRALDVPAEEWEAFSHVEGRFVWDDPVDTAAALAEKLAFRGHDQAAYAAALDRSVDRGWLARDGERYTATDEGRRVRADAEVETDARFFGPWRIGPEETRELRQSMEAVLAALGG